jgi:hypothetical protein
MNILNSYRHIRPKKVKYPIPEIPDDSGKKSGTDWVLPKIIGSGRVSGTRQALLFGVWNTELRLEHCQMEQLDFPHEIGQKSDTILVLQYI